MKRVTFNPDEKRKFILGFILLVLFVYSCQLFVLQIMNSDYKAWADSNAFYNKIIYPSRGLIYDRYGKLLVFNQPAYDLMVITKETVPFDTLSMCHILNVSIADFREKFNEVKDRKINPGYSPYTPQTLFTQLGDKEYGVLQESLYKFPGFYIQNRTIRQYNTTCGANILGYIAETDQGDLDNDDYYIRGDYIGKAGIEKTYEKDLRGTRGVEILLRDSRGRIKGKYKNGQFDKMPVNGKNLSLSIDSSLQAYGESLMKNKIGSIIMIEPSTGEILCMVSSPSYNPALLTGRNFGKNYVALANDPYTPLINRPLNGVYPPGSTFKPAQGLVYLQDRIISPSTLFTCNRGFPLNHGKPKCERHRSPLNLIDAIEVSCNSYFCWGLYYLLSSHKSGGIKKALDRWRDHMVAQGFGYKLGIDLPGEKRGMIPNSEYYDKMLKFRWNPLTIISIAIGQGEVAATPLQICNLAASIANRGYFYTPHIVKSIEKGPVGPQFTTRRNTGIEPRFYQPIIEGMRGVVLRGTGWRANIPSIEVCGKTGTAQNRGKDHSIFMAFAPMDHPKVAISVYIENGGWGSEFASPIARLMIEKAILKKIPNSDKGLEEKMKNAIILRSALQRE